MLAVQPVSLDRGDEELRAVAIKITSQSRGVSSEILGSDIRVGTGVGHGKDTRAGVGVLEVLIGKFLAIDRFAAGSLEQLSVMRSQP